MTATSRPAALRQALGEARIAHRVAANRIARLERTLGVVDVPDDDLVRHYADLYGDTPGVTAARRQALVQDSIAMDGRVKAWRESRGAAG